MGAVPRVETGCSPRGPGALIPAQGNLVPAQRFVARVAVTEESTVKIVDIGVSNGVKWRVVGHEGNSKPV